MEKFRMSTINAISVGNAAYRVSKYAYPPQVPSITEYNTLLKEIYFKFSSSEHFDLRLMSRSQDFLGYGIMGAPGGELLSPAIWTLESTYHLFGLLNNAKNAFIQSTFFTIYSAANLYENVYVVSNAASLMASKHLGNLDIENVTTLTWDEAYHNMPSIDIAIVGYSSLIMDNALLTSCLDSLSLNGVLVILNSGDGGALYTALGDKKPLEMAIPLSSSSRLHKEIIDRGDFITHHISGFLSLTICTKVS